MSTGSDQLLAWVWNDFSVSQFDEVIVIIDEFVAVKSRTALRVQKQILFNLVSHYLR